MGTEGAERERFLRDEYGLDDGALASLRERYLE